MPLYELIIIGRCSPAKTSILFLKSVATNVMDRGGKLLGRVILNSKKKKKKSIKDDNNLTISYFFPR